MENWEAFQSSVDELNAFVQPYVLRKYQADLLSNGFFPVVSPVSGSIVRVNRSILIRDRIAYLLDDNEKLWIVSDYIGLGYPLHELFVESDGTRHALLKHRKSKIKALRKKDFRKHAAHASRSYGTTGNSEVALVIGHVSFAHHLWNELSALNHWLRIAASERVAKLAVVKVAEPLGPLEEIFPLLANASIVSATPEELEETVSRLPIAVRVGSRLVTGSVRQQIRDYSERKSVKFDSHPARALLEHAWPRIWISVRLKSRTADNQEEFLLKVIGKIFEKYPSAAVLIDGFSFPVGFFDDPRTIKQRGLFTAWAGELDSFITELCRKAREEFGARVASRISSISGLELPDAIRFGEYCDYYVCHIGTLQHKIAWLHNIPGIIHGPRPKEKHAAHFAAQVEGGIVPDILPANLIVQSASDRMNERNLNYQFTDLQKSAQCVIDSMELRLKQRTSPHPPLS